MRIKYSIWTLAAFLLASCSDPKEEGNDEYLPFQGKVDVTFSVILPQPKLVKASTRGDGIYNHGSTDTDIKNMDLLVFDKDANFMERVKVEHKDLKVTGNRVSFTVRLDGTAEKRIIHLVANGHENLSEIFVGLQDEDRLNFDDLSVGMPEQDAISSLRTTEQKSFFMSEFVETGSGGIGPLLMWGRLVLERGTNASDPITEVSLLRATAAIQVTIGDVAGQGLDEFKIEKIYFHKAYEQGFLAPADCTGTVSTPTTANPFPGAQTSIWPKQGSWGETLPLTGHVYERNCTPDDYMSIIIGAYYKGQLGYYKVVMTDRDGMPLNIIRNHRYIIKILGVNSIGSRTAWYAADMPFGTGQLKVELTDAHTDFPIIAASANEILAASNNEVIFYGNVSAYFKDIKSYYNYSGGPSWKPVTICRLYSSFPQTAVNLRILRNGLDYGVDPPGTEWMNIEAKAEEEDLNGFYDETNHFRIEGSVRLPQPQKEFMSGTLQFQAHDAILSMPISWYPDIPGKQADGSFVFDLIDPADKNWNIRVEDPVTTPWLTLSPSANFSPSDLGNSKVSELSSKYASHAYLHVDKSAPVDAGTLLKTSATGGKPKVTKIVITSPNPGSWLSPWSFLHLSPPI